MRLKGKALIFGMAIILALFTGALAATTTEAPAKKKGFLWNGTHWTQLTFNVKVGFIKGVGNMADFENAVGGSGRSACISRAFVNELQTKTIKQIIEEVDKFYKENPKKLQTSVIEVILRRCTKVCPPEPPASEKKK
jgi:hypothetical protein